MNRGAFFFKLQIIGYHLRQASRYLAALGEVPKQPTTDELSELLEIANRLLTLCVDAKRVEGNITETKEALGDSIH